MPRETTGGERAGAVIASAVLTVAFVVGMAVSVRGYHHVVESGPRAEGEPLTREQVTFVQPRVLAPPVVPPPRVPPPRVVTPAISAPRSAAPRASDSASTVAPPFVPARAVPGDAAPSAPGVRGPSSSCVGPCDATTTVGIRSVGGTVSTSEQRDSVLHAMREGMRGAASSGGVRSGMGGVSIAVGLPGGGPTRAQRKRDSTINADVVARLDRIRARADSVAKADSMARAGKP